MIITQRECLTPSQTEEKWAFAMEMACNYHVQTLKGRAMRDDFLDAMARTLFINPDEFGLPQPPSEFRPYTPPQKGDFPIQGFYWGRTAEDHPASLIFYRKGKYRPHAHGAAWVKIINGGGFGFHHDDRFPGCSAWFDLKPGMAVRHPDDVDHGYIMMQDTLVLAIGSRPATRNSRPATPAAKHAFNRVQLPVNG